MKTFDEVMTEVQPGSLKSSVAGFRDELLNNQKFQVVINTIAADALERLTTDIEQVTHGAEVNNVANNVALSLIACLSTAFQIGMVVGMRMASGESKHRVQ